jgi:hypothetical protein
MAENINTGKETNRNSINKNSKKPSDEIIFSEEPIIINIKLKNKNMVTHAHHLHKAPGNKFWHFFLNSLCCFLPCSADFWQRTCGKIM